jgi:DHA1 family multidrug resistance protein-like MFS transporter
MIATFLGMMFQLFVGRILDKKGRRPVFLAAMIGYPIIYLTIYLLSGSWIAIFIIYSYPLYALRNPSANAIMSDLTDEKERSRGMSLLSFEQSIFLNSGSFIGAYIADISSQGILILPIFPVAFGVITVILAFFFMKETNRKLLRIMTPNV